MRLEIGHDAPKKIRVWWGRIGKCYAHLTVSSKWKNWDIGVLVSLSEQMGTVSLGPLELVITWDK